MIERPPRDRTLDRRPDGIWRGAFFSMASPCELLARTEKKSTAEKALALVSDEAWRIETKFSRYREDSVVAEIHRARGSWITLDDETTRLLLFAQQVWELSSGSFDITSGVLRRAWSFQPGSVPPDQESVEQLLPLVGWSRVDFDPPKIRLPEGMEIDLGGIGKEYAVDRAAELVGQLEGAYLVNFGGDLRAVPPRDGRQTTERFRAHDEPPGAGPESSDDRSGPARESAIGWSVGVESPLADEVAIAELQLTSGALATSGDAKRAVVHGGVRYGHVLDPRTGWPVPGAPRSVTVHAPTCVEAGMVATLALLQGPDAESFLEEQGFRHWCVR
ncbi:MAG: FAD:protein FMN transferase [Candidatus Eisenbacteria bacterium]